MWFLAFFASPSLAQCSPGPGVLIAEILPDGPGADAGQEFVELVNFLPNPRDLGGWVVEAGTSTYSQQLVLPAGTVIPGGGTLLLAQFVGGDVLYTDADLTMGNASANSDAVRLVDCGGAVIDTVVYGPPGDPNPDGWLDDDLQLAVPAVRPGPGESLGRVSFGVDANLADEDFAVYASPTPGDVNPFHVAVSDLVAGQPATVVVRGPLPGATVYLAASTSPGVGPCPAGLGACLDLVSPVLVGTARSGIARRATFNVTVPAGLAGVDLYVQGAAVELPFVSFVASDHVD
ncbi:MAG: lamin tail domain-containing protein [Myxococcales bacterium]|nr:lamin tail domain-containing protein [Myxococcales bacterium]